MQRVALIGNAGGGKSRLARLIAETQGLPLHAVDRIQWRPGWKAAPEPEVTQALDTLLDKPTWVIDGWGPWPTIERRFEAADTIVLVDHPLWVHFWWTSERQLACARGEARPDGPEGCSLLDVTPRLYKLIWDIDREMMPRLRTLITSLEGCRRVIRLGSPQALDTFSAALGP